MGNHDDTKRRTGKDKQKDTFNLYGKNTARGLRITLELQQRAKSPPRARPRHRVKSRK